MNPTPKRHKIAKFQLQILVDNSQRISKRTYLLKIEEKMSKLRCFKVETIDGFIIAFLQRERRVGRGGAARDQVCWMMAKFSMASQVCI